MLTECSLWVALTHPDAAGILYRDNATRVNVGYGEELNWLHDLGASNALTGRLLLCVCEMLLWSKVNTFFAMYTLHSHC